MMELLLAMVVHSAGIQDRAGAKASLVRLLLRFACLKAPLLWMAATRALGPVENPLLCCNPAMERRVLSDKQWALMASHCLGKLGDAGPRGTDNRLFVEAVLWIVRTGSPWRDLPEEFGKWNTVFKRFRDGGKAGIWQKRFDAVSGQPDMEYAMVDATIVKVHRHGQGAGLKARP